MLVSSGNAEFDAYAVECASHWTYKPAMTGGKPVAVQWMAMMRMQKTDELAAFDTISSSFFQCLKASPAQPDEMSRVRRIGDHLYGKPRARP